MNGATTPTLYDAIDAGLRLDLSARATLAAWRALGGRCRTADFMERWRYRRAQLAEVEGTWPVADAVDAIADAAEVSAK